MAREYAIDTPDDMVFYLSRIELLTNLLYKHVTTLLKSAENSPIKPPKSETICL